MGGLLNFSFCIASAVALYHSGYLWLVWLPVACAIICLWSWMAIRHRAYAAARIRQRARIRESAETAIIPSDEDLDQVPNWIVDANLLATSVAVVFLLWQITVWVV